MTGFTFYFKGKDVFVKTNLVNKTQSLASKIIRQLVNIGYDIPDNREVRSDILWHLQKAKCEILTLSNGRRHYEIYGDNFGGKGSFVDDGNTIIINLEGGDNY